ncbi:hypothetical protein JX266_014445, partial [Neoarthrinium moseri]
PDAQFQHSDAAYPGVVLEISYSQNGKNLDKLAWDYILKSNGAIRVVIGIDLDYSGTHESSISIWRAVFLQEDGEELESLDVKREITHESKGAPEGSTLHGDLVLAAKLSGARCFSESADSGSELVWPAQAWPWPCDSSTMSAISSVETGRAFMRACRAQALLDRRSVSLGSVEALTARRGRSGKSRDVVGRGSYVGAW